MQFLAVAEFAISDLIQMKEHDNVRAEILRGDNE